MSDNYKYIVITGHIASDFDTFSSIIAAYLLLKNKSIEYFFPNYHKSNIGLANSQRNIHCSSDNIVIDFSSNTNINNNNKGNGDNKQQVTSATSCYENYDDSKENEVDSTTNDTSSNNNYTHKVICLLPPTQYKHVLKYYKRNLDILTTQFNFINVSLLPQHIADNVTHVIIVDTKRMSRLKHIHNILIDPTHKQILQHQYQQQQKHQQQFRQPNQTTTSVGTATGPQPTLFQQNQLNQYLQIKIFDHHPSSSDDLVTTIDGSGKRVDIGIEKKGMVNVESYHCGSNTSILVNKLKLEKIVAGSDDIATSIAMGIYEDSGRLSFSSTNHLDFVAMEYLTRHNKLDMSAIRKYACKMSEEEHHHHSEKQQIKQEDDEKVVANVPAPYIYSPTSSLKASIESNEKEKELSNYTSTKNRKSSGNGNGSGVDSLQSMDLEDLEILYQLKKSKYKVQVGGHTIDASEVVSNGKLKSLSPMAQLYMDRNKEINTLLCYGQSCDSIVLICRSSLPNEKSFLDFGRICEKLGGGGHASAASVTFKDYTLAEVKTLVYALIYAEMIGKDQIVKDHLQLNPLTLNSDQSIQSCIETFEKINFKSMLVVNSQGKVVGIVDYIDLVLANKNAPNSSIRDIMKPCDTEHDCLLETDTLDKAITNLIVQGRSVVPILSSGEYGAKRLIGTINSHQMIYLLVNCFCNGKLCTSYRICKKMDKLNLIPSSVYKQLQLINQMCIEIGNVECFLTDKCVHQLLRNDIQSMNSFEMLCLGSNSSKLFERIVVHYSSLKDIEVHNNNNNNNNNHNNNKKKWEITQEKDSLILTKAKFTIEFNLYSRYCTYNPSCIYSYQPSQIRLVSFSRVFSHYGLVMSLKDNMVYDFFHSKQDIKDGVLRTLHSNTFMNYPDYLLLVYLEAKSYKLSISPQTKRFMKNASHYGIGELINGRTIINFYKELFNNYPTDYHDTLRDIQTNGILSSLYKHHFNVRMLSCIDQILEWYSGFHLDMVPNRFVIYFISLIMNEGIKDMEGAKPIFDRLKLDKPEREYILHVLETVRIKKRDIKNWVMENDPKEIKSLKINSLFDIFNTNLLETPRSFEQPSAICSNHSNNHAHIYHPPNQLCIEQSNTTQQPPSPHNPSTTNKNITGRNLEWILLLMACTMEANELNPKKVREYLLFQNQLPFNLYFNINYFQTSNHK